MTETATIPVRITAEDFSYLCEESLPWRDFPQGSGRFEGESVKESGASRVWRRIYWLGQNYANVILARAFLAANGYGCQMLFDAAVHPNGQCAGWVLLTDYEDPRLCVIPA